MIVIEDIVEELLHKNLAESPVSIEPLKGALNSLVYKVITDKGSEYFIKKYIVHEGDSRDRFSTEYFGISFLWNNGIRAISEPMCSDVKQRIGIYRFIRGNKLRPGGVSEEDVYRASEFLGALHALVNAEGADRQPVASEACFSIKAYIECIENRLRRLRALPKRKGVFKKFHTYLDEWFLPFFAEIEQFVKMEAKQRHIDIDRQLHKNEKTLSPSDFGFHNVIKSDNGSLVFIDFEYYGWDDPAKMIADFYLQPAVPVPTVYRERFFERIHKYLDNDVALIQRLPLVYILLGLKWCLIMLNMFLKPTLNTELNEQTCSSQLEKARIKLKETMREFEVKAFPILLS